jgi:hypothetical protein
MARRPLDRKTALLAIATTLLVGAAAPASADITAFIGGNTTPDTRAAKGVAIGMSFALIGVEVEYSATRENGLAAAPGLKTGMFNGFIQTPLPVGRFQPYVTVGAGVYDETLGAHDDKGLGVNVGGGVKVTLAGPLRVRGDYRVFKLGSGALTSPARRFYVGLNLGF